MQLFDITTKKFNTHTHTEHVLAYQPMFLKKIINIFDRYAGHQIYAIRQ